MCALSSSVPGMHIATAITPSSSCSQPLLTLRVPSYSQRCIDPICAPSKPGATQQLYVAQSRGLPETLLSLGPGTPMDNFTYVCRVALEEPRARRAKG